MADKATITTTAQKFLAKGQYDMAIAEMMKLIGDRTDGNIFNTIGDLYAKKKELKEAVEYFAKAADIFRKDGFNLKAIGLYKKILNILPSDIGALTALAELNEEKGLIGNAVDNYLTVADIYIKEKTTEKAFEIFQKVLSISPNNINLKMKIARQYDKIGLSGECLILYGDIASAYLSAGTIDKAREYYGKVLNADPKNVKSLLGLSRVAEQENDLEQATAHIEKALSFSPNNGQILLRRAQLLVLAGERENARDILSRLIEADPSFPQARKLLGEMYIEENEFTQAWGVLMPYIDDAIASENTDDALEYLKSLKEVDPIAVLQRLAHVHKSRGHIADAVKALEQLAELYKEGNQHNSALTSYKEILDLDLGNEQAQNQVRVLEELMAIAAAPHEHEDPGGESGLDIEVDSGPAEGISTEGEVGIEKSAAPSGDTAPPTGDSVTMSAEEFQELKTEADFYLQYGFREQALKLFERLLAASPDNSDIKEKLKSIRSVEAPETEEEMEKTAQPVDADIFPDSDVEGIFREFQEGIEKEVSEKDSNTHYNLGIAYKEMGLIENAIRELEIASNDPEKKVLSLGMIAMCYMSQGQYPAAIKEYEKAIAMITSDNDNYLGFKYDLSNAYLKNKDYRNALKILLEINVVAPEFRDVPQLIDKVKEIVSRDNGHHKKDRVSYI